jgi:hypothetical protein
LNNYNDGTDDAVEYEKLTTCRHRHWPRNHQFEFQLGFGTGTHAATTSIQGMQSKGVEIGKSVGFRAAHGFGIASIWEY